MLPSESTAIGAHRQADMAFGFQLVLLFIQGYSSTIFSSTISFLQYFQSSKNLLSTSYSTYFHTNKVALHPVAPESPFTYDNSCECKKDQLLRIFVLIFNQSDCLTTLHSLKLLFQFVLKIRNLNMLISPPKIKCLPLLNIKKNTVCTN